MRTNSQPGDALRRPVIRLAHYLLVPIPPHVIDRNALTDDDYLWIEPVENGFLCRVDRTKREPK